MALPLGPTAAPASGFRSADAPLSGPLRTTLRDDGYWHRGCPVALSRLRVLTMSYRGFDGRRHRGRIVVNASATRPLTRVFRTLYALHFPIRRMGVEPV